MGRKTTMSRKKENHREFGGGGDDDERKEWDDRERTILGDKNEVMRHCSLHIPEREHSASDDEKLV